MWAREPCCSVIRGARTALAEVLFLFARAGLRMPRRRLAAVKGERTKTMPSDRVSTASVDASPAGHACTNAVRQARIGARSKIRRGADRGHDVASCVLPCCGFQRRFTAAWSTGEPAAPPCDAFCRPACARIRSPTQRHEVGCLLCYSLSPFKAARTSPPATQARASLPTPDDRHATNPSFGTSPLRTTSMRHSDRQGQLLLWTVGSPRRVPAEPIWLMQPADYAWLRVRPGFGERRDDDPRAATILGCETTPPRLRINGCVSATISQGWLGSRPAKLRHEIYIAAGVRVSRSACLYTRSPVAGEVRPDRRHRAEPIHPAGMTDPARASGLGASSVYPSCAG